MKKGANIERTGREVALITYSLTNLSHSDKTRFGYALKGRDGKSGISNLINGEPVGRNNILIPYNKLHEIIEFFLTWKVKYTVRRFIELE